MTDDGSIGEPDLATEEDMDAWVEIGRADPHALEIYWHAHHAARSAWRECDCPFGDEHPVARKLWLDMFRINVKGRAPRHQKELDEANGKAPDKKGQWWMRY